MREDFATTDPRGAEMYQRHNAVEPLPREDYNDLPIGRHDWCGRPDCWACTARMRAHEVLRGGAA